MLMEMNDGVIFTKKFDNFYQHFVSAISVVENFLKLDSHVHKVVNIHAQYSLWHCLKQQKIVCKW